MNTTMKMIEEGKGLKLDYPGTVRASVLVAWQSPEGKDCREPREKTTVYGGRVGFSAAGKPYQNIAQLTAQQTPGSPWARDIYGRDVFCFFERFPIFDSYDARNDFRHFRWFFIREGNVLTRIQYTDGQDQTIVTEDVRQLEQRCWEVMQDTDWVK